MSIVARQQAVLEIEMAVPNSSAKRWLQKIAATVLLTAALLSHSTSRAQETLDTLPKQLDLHSVPLGLNKRPTETNPSTVAQAALGRRLFFDTRLSADGKVSCATCHKPLRGFATADPIAVGIDGRKGKRNAPTLFNRAFGQSQFWDGRVASLEQQAVLPIENPDEMGHDFTKLLPELRGDKDLVKQFRAAYSDPAKEKTVTEKAAAENLVSRKNIAHALAAFQRTLVLGNSPVDQFQHAGKHGALTTLERTGMWLFESRARCWKCHSGRNFTDEKFHNTGVSAGTTARDTGRFQVTEKEADRFRFKTPTLRGVSLTAPYMHDGSMETLEDVVRFYSKGGGIQDPTLDDDLEKLDLSDNEIAALVAFLKALTPRSFRQSRDEKSAAKTE